MPVHEHEATLDAAVALRLTVLSDLPARIFPLAGELQARQRAERIVSDCRREIAEKCLKRADEVGAAEAQATGHDDGPNAPTPDK